MLRKYFLAALLSTLILIGIVIYQSDRFTDGKLHVTFCNVGQGDGIFIRTPKGIDIVIDGGPDNSILSCLAKHMPFWDRTIELMILTHPHEDHFYGLSQISKRYTITSFATQPQTITSEGYQSFIANITNKRTTIRSLCQDDAFTLSDGTSLKTLWPTSCEKRTAEEGTDLNTLSVVQLLSFGEFQLLLTGDIDASIASLVDDMVGDVDVLKVPHHGSGTGFTTDFLSHTTPELAVISVGEKNRYGHPSQTILNYLQEKSIKTFRTDQQGDINIVSDGKTFWVTR